MISIIGTVSVLFAIYTLISTSGIFSEKSGIINISLEGTMVSGALGYLLTTYLLTKKGTIQLEPWMPVVGIAAAIAFGIVATLFLSFAAINLRGNQVMIGTAINILMPAVSLAVIFFLTKNGMLPMKQLQITTGLKTGIKDWQIQSIIAGIVLFILLFMIFVMNKTRFGLKIKAVGQNPHALASAGGSVTKTRHKAMIMSGILAGLAGAIAISTYSKFASDTDPYAHNMLGMGFIGITILIVGQWKIHWSIIASIFFVGVFATVDYFAIKLGNYQYLLMTIPYIYTILILPIIINEKSKPLDLGKPYIPNQ